MSWFLVAYSLGHARDEQQLPSALGDVTDIALVDGVSGDSFEVADDMSLTADFDAIAPGESAKHFYTVTPKSTGQAGLNRATVEYSYIEDDSEDEMDSFGRCCGQTDHRINAS